jgi:hypothetical protein
MNLHRAPTGAIDDHLSERDIREEIEYLEKRLVSMDEADDSAYEKMLARAYRSLLEARRHRLGA